MIAELGDDQKLAVLEMGDQVIRRKFRIGFLRPRLDLNITKPVVTGLSSLKRTSEAVMEYSEVDEMPNFNVKFNAQLSNVNAKGGVKGKVSRIPFTIYTTISSEYISDFSGQQFSTSEED